MKNSELDGTMDIDQVQAADLLESFEHVQALGVPVDRLVQAADSVSARFHFFYVFRCTLIYVNWHHPTEVIFLKLDDS